MEMEKAKKVVGEMLDKMATEAQYLTQKKGWNASDIETAKKMLEGMEKACCVLEMAEGGSSGRSGYSGDGYASRSGEYSSRSGGYSSRGRSRSDGRSYEGGYSERSRGADGRYRSGDEYSGEYSGHSIEDRMIDQMESMAGRAGNDYERQRIQEGIEALRRVFN